MGKMLKGDVIPFQIGIIIFAGAMMIMFLTIDVRYTYFEADFDKGIEEKMQAVDVLHMVKRCMSEGDKRDLVDKSKLAECNKWSDKFEVGFGSFDSSDHSVYVTTKTGKIERLYVRKK